jgi:hypothetical protein
MGKEFAILIAVHLSTAELHCPYRLEPGRLSRFLQQYELSMGDVFSAPRSRELQERIETLRAEFRDDWERACDYAWRSFGPGAPYEGFLQLRNPDRR